MGDDREVGFFWRALGTLEKATAQGFILDLHVSCSGRLLISLLRFSVVIQNGQSTVAVVGRRYPGVPWWRLNQGVAKMFLILLCSVGFCSCPFRLRQQPAEGIRVCGRDVVREWVCRRRCTCLSRSVAAGWACVRIRPIFSRCYDSLRAEGDDRQEERGLRIYQRQGP